MICAKKNPRDKDARGAVKLELFVEALSSRA
jgi:hypothetical protein